MPPRESTQSKPTATPETSEPAKKKRSPEYVALGLYKRANAIDESIATLNLKLKEKRAEQTILTEEVATHPSDVREIYNRLRPAPTPVTLPMQDAAKKGAE